jgi:hypothetical protein
MCIIYIYKYLSKMCIIDDTSVLKKDQIDTSIKF